MEDSQYKNLFEHLPYCLLLLQPNPPIFTIAQITDAYLKATSTNRSIIGKGISEVFPDNPDESNPTGVKNLNASLYQVYETQEPHEMPVQKYDIINQVTNQIEVKYWKSVNKPVFDAAGKLIYIIHTVEDVTHQAATEDNNKIAEQENNKVNEEKAALLDSITDGFLSVNKEGCITYCNKAFECITEEVASNIIGKAFSDFFPALPEEPCFEQLKNSIAKGVKGDCEYYEPKLNKWIKLNIYPSSNEVCVFILDVTAIKNSERKFKSIIDNSIDGITLVTANAIMIDINPAGLEMLGYDASEMIGQQRSDMLHPEDTAKVNKVFIDILTKYGKSEIINYRVKVKQGHYIWLEAVFTNLLNEPAVLAIIINYRDITQRIRHEELIEASEKKYRYLFQNNPASIILWSLETLKPIEANETALKIYRYTSEEFKTITILDTRPPEEQDYLLNFITLTKSTDHLISLGTRRHITKHGEAIFMDTYFRKINYNGEDVILSMSNNVTEKVLLEKRLEQEKREKQIEITEAVIAAQENERAILSKELHDNINQILSTTRLYIEYTLSRKEYDEALLISSKEFLTKAVEELRQLSKNLLPSSLREHSLHDAVREIADSITKLSGIQFYLELDHIDEVVHNDAFKLSLFRIIQEQTNNILKHSRANQVWIKFIHNREMWQLEIKDDGIGYDLTKKRNGLGLRNIYSRASIYNGKVNIESEPGKGFAVYIRFPRNNSSLQQSP